MKSWVHEMRYKSNSSAYRIFTLVPDTHGRVEFVSVRTGTAREGYMDTERFLRQYGNSADLISALAYEKWLHDISKPAAVKKLEAWRKVCLRVGLDKVLQWKGDGTVIKNSTHNEESQQ